MTRARWACAAALCAAITGCGQQAPQDLSYVLVELDQMGGSKGPADVLVEVSSSVAPSTKLCIGLVPEGTGTPASFVLFRKFGANPAPRATLVVTSFASLEGDTGPGSQFACPDPLPTMPFAPVQKVSFDFCEGESVKVQVDVGSKCDGCTSTEVCAAGLSTDGAPCGPTECCAMAISDACALVPVPTTTSPAP
jgi:hypothetical protein